MRGAVGGGGREGPGSREAGGDPARPLGRPSHLRVDGPRPLLRAGIQYGARPAAPDRPPRAAGGCVSRLAGLTMTRNLNLELTHALDIQRMGIEAARKTIRLEPAVPLEVAPGLDLGALSMDILRAYREAVGPVRLTTEQGSNNWVVDGTMTTTGRPILANDPHRPVQLPSLRKTVHLVGPGWNAIGAGEPALPGIALGHNENVAFGFTIVGIDQQDLYVEKVNPENPAEYRYQGGWKKMEIERQEIAVKGAE